MLPGVCWMSATGARSTTDVHGPQSLRCSRSHTTPPTLPNIQLQSTHTMQTLAIIEAHLTCSSECVGWATAARSTTTDVQHGPPHHSQVTPLLVLGTYCQTINHDQYTQCKLKQSLKLTWFVGSMLDVSN